MLLITASGRFAGLAVCIALSACGGRAGSTESSQTRGPQLPAHLDRHILIDQFGYRPDDRKVAVIRNPQSGYDANDHFSPGAHYEVRRAGDGVSVWAGALTAWNDGKTQASSGDQGWWFDFSALRTSGRYYIQDTERGVRSAGFVIDDGVYRNVLKAALRMFFYQRSGFAKRTPFADACWTDEAAYLGPDQDRAAHDVDDPDNLAKVRDVSGGWFDAGDTNKYVTFAAQTVHQLLTAYQENSKAFTDDFNIPESGNKIPDLIDEVRWETDWLKKMQFEDGSLALKVGTLKDGNASPPSADTTPRFYISSCTSATIAGAGMFAHAALVYAGFAPLAPEAADLKTRAIHAWTRYLATPDKQLNCDRGAVRAGNADRTLDQQNGWAVEAAIYLFAITSDPVYSAYVAAHYHETHPYHDAGWSRYDADQGESLLFFTSLPNVDHTLAAAILQDKRADADAGNHIYGFAPDDDLYRAFLTEPQYHWGSNSPRANTANSNLDAARYVPGAARNLAAGNAATTANDGEWRLRALEMLHYFHGVNPLDMVYLSNMRAYGATFSANEIYHAWFRPKSRWSDAYTSDCGPAPGFVPGGPNADAVRDGVPPSLSPPTGQPAQKSYKDWNVGWPESSWAITEPAIYYQAAYLKLLSAFVN